MQLRQYQERSVAFHLPRKRAFTVAPAGSGKTIMAAAAAARKLQALDRLLWLANTREQVQQAHAALSRVKLAPGVAVHACCVASRPSPHGFDLVIVDECHHLPAKSWWDTLAGYDGCVWGYSATPISGDEERDDALVGFFEEENFFAVHRDEVMAGGSLASGVVRVHDVDAPGAFDARITSLTEQELAVACARFPWQPVEELRRRIRWRHTQEAVYGNTARNAKVCELARQSDAALVLVGSIEHGQALAAQIEGACMVHSKMGTKKRAQAIEAFRVGNLRCMVATSLADEGLDVPRAQTLVLAAGGRSSAKLEQRAGRVMRPHESKTFGVVHDFADKGASMAHAQFLARLRTYRELGYTIA